MSHLVPASTEYVRRRSRGYDSVFSFGLNYKWVKLDNEWFSHLPRLRDLWACTFPIFFSIINRCRAWVKLARVSKVVDSTTLLKSTNRSFSDVSPQWGYFCRHSKCGNSVGNRLVHGRHRIVWSIEWISKSTTAFYSKTRWLNDCWHYCSLNNRPMGLHVM